MVNGLYTASRGMSNILSKQDAHAQNLSNANSTGFKLSRVVNRVEIEIGRNDELKLHQDEDQRIDDRYTSFAQGPMVNTGNRLDFALTSPGFFAIEGADGTRYTRNGSFAMNSYGELVTLSGRRVLDEGGSPIKMQGEGAVQIMEDGNLYRDGKRATRIGVVDFADTHKLKQGTEGLYENFAPESNPPRPPETVGIKQGFLEGSNVNTIDTMVNMMAEFRNYEADQKALQAINDTLGKAVNEVGRV